MGPPRLHKELQRSQVLALLFGHVGVLLPPASALPEARLRPSCRCCRCRCRCRSLLLLLKVLVVHLPKAREPQKGFAIERVPRQGVGRLLTKASQGRRAEHAHL